jgi:DNA-binding winged helix-turn-helix (wHTH) protein/TolB-like protein
MDAPGEGRRYRFGRFEFHPATLELRRNGQTVRVRPQALKLLSLLLTRPGEVVSREQIEKALWGTETFVDFEQGVNHCVKQLRHALGDSAESPRYIETLPRRGYRFLAPAELVEADSAHEPQGSAENAHVDVIPRRRFGRVTTAAIAATALAAIIALGAYSRRTPASRMPQVLAVMPFTTSGTDATFGFGLAEAISSRLGHQRILPVRPPAAAGDVSSDAALIAAARKAGATQVLSGEVLASGADVTVITHLTEVSTGERTWNGRHHVRGDELFSVENVLAERVAEALGLRIVSAEQERLRRRYTTNAAAYADYLRGRAALALHTPEGTRRAVEAFESALRQDEAYVLARAGRAMACADMYLRFAPPSEVERWTTCAEKDARAALEVDSELAEAHLARAAVARKREFDWATAIASSRRALLLNSNLDQAHFFIAAAYYHLGYMEESLIEMEHGRNLRGADVVEPLRIEALVALFSGNFAPARVHLEAVSQRSSQTIGDTYLALAYYYSGNARQGRTLLKELSTHSSASTQARAAAALAGVLAAEGETDAARSTLDRVLALEYRDHHVAYSIGAAYAQLGDHRQALTWLGRAADTGFPCLIWFERDPLLEPLRNRAEFSQILERIKTQRQAAVSRASATGAQ